MTSWFDRTLAQVALEPIPYILGQLRQWDTSGPTEAWGRNDRKKELKNANPSNEENGM